MTKRGYVYILASKPYGTLYVGVTSDLSKRIWQHKTGYYRGFTFKYKVHKLVYFEEHDSIRDAISREKELKGRRRDRKIALITSMNEKWVDLYEALL